MGNTGNKIIKTKTPKDIKLASELWTHSALVPICRPLHHIIKPRRNFSHSGSVKRCLVCLWLTLRDPSAVTPQQKAHCGQKEGNAAKGPWNANRSSVFKLLKDGLPSHENVTGVSPFRGAVRFLVCHCRRLSRNTEEKKVKFFVCLFCLLPTHASKCALISRTG